MFGSVEFENLPIFVSYLFLTSIIKNESFLIKLFQFLGFTNSPVLPGFFTLFANGTISSFNLIFSL